MGVFNIGVLLCPCHTSSNSNFQMGSLYNSKEVKFLWHGFCITV